MARAYPLTCSNVTSGGMERAQWSVTKSLVDVVKAIVNSIDHPDIDYALSLS